MLNSPFHKMAYHMEFYLIFSSLSHVAYMHFGYSCETFCENLCLFFDTMYLYYRIVMVSILGVYLGKSMAFFTLLFWSCFMISLLITNDMYLSSWSPLIYFVIFHTEPPLIHCM